MILVNNAYESEIVEDTGDTKLKNKILNQLIVIIFNVP